MNRSPFQSDFEDPKSQLPDDYFDFSVLRKSIYEELNVSACTWSDVANLLYSSDSDDVEDALKILRTRSFKEALPRLEELAINGENFLIRKEAEQIINAIGTPESRKILNRINPRTKRQSVDELVRIALYDEDLGVREEAVSKLIRRKSQEAQVAITCLANTEHRELIMRRKGRSKF